MSIKIQSSVVGHCSQVRYIHRGSNETISSRIFSVRVVVVTSTLPDEGKATIALNLAAALGQMEKTLIIGGDMRKPSLAKKVGLAHNHQGLSHFVTGNAKRAAAKTGGGYYHYGDYSSSNKPENA
jgi:Mrp family chromosome partitioning ATPase